MNVIIVTENNEVQTPFICKSNTKASAKFRGICEQYLSDDELKEINFGMDNEIHEANKLLFGYDIKIDWFEVETNKIY